MSGCFRLMITKDKFISANSLWSCFKQVSAALTGYVLGFFYKIFFGLVSDIDDDSVSCLSALVELTPPKAACTHSSPVAISSLSHPTWEGIPASSPVFMSSSTCSSTVMGLQRDRKPWKHENSDQQWSKMSCLFAHSCYFLL